MFTTESTPVSEAVKAVSSEAAQQRTSLCVSDVFEDVCDGSTVFGAILREIKSPKTNSKLSVPRKMKVTRSEVHFHTAEQTLPADDPAYPPPPQTQGRLYFLS
ncbi:unnamed protein product [Arctogadus glacialis]